MYALRELDLIHKVLFNSLMGPEPAASEEETNELWHLRNEMKVRLEREEGAEVSEETALGHETVTWEVRMTKQWLVYTA